MKVDAGALAQPAMREDANGGVCDASGGLFAAQGYGQRRAPVGRRISAGETCDDGNSIDEDAHQRLPKRACGDGIVRGDLDPGVVGVRV